MKKVVIILLAMAFLIATFFWCAGCKSQQTSPQTSPLKPIVDELGIAGVRATVTMVLAPRVEDAYRRGKINKDVYQAAREQERLALEDFDELAAKAAVGEAVTQEELNAAKQRHLKALIGLIQKYIPSTDLPPEQS